MALKKLKKDDWRSDCELISHDIARGLRAELEVVSLVPGNAGAMWVPIHKLAYDPKTDLLEIAVKGVGIDHFVAHPVEFLVATKPRGIVALEIVAPDAARRVVRFLEPFSLPPDRMHALRALPNASRQGHAGAGPFHVLGASSLPSDLSEQTAVVSD